MTDDVVSDSAPAPGRRRPGLVARLDERPSQVRRLELGLLALILGLAAAFRFHALGDQPLWLDEGYSWWDAQQSLLDIWRLVPQCDPHPPLYFVLLKGWAGLFGDSALAMRSLSAGIGVLTTLVVYLAGRQIKPSIGLVAALFFALTPFQIEFAHEARPYTLLCLGAALMVLGALRIVRPGTSGRAAMLGWVAVVLGSVIVLWANNTSALLVASLFGGLIVLTWADPEARPRWPIVVLAGVVVAALWLPYLPHLLEQARGVSSDFWIQKPEGWRLTNELRFVVSMSDYQAVWWAVAALALGAVLLWRGGRRRQALVLLALGVAPVMLNYAISMSVKSIFIGRALIGVAPALAVLLAAAIMMLKAPRLRGLALSAMVIAHGVAIANMYENDRGKEPWDQIAAQLATALREDGVHQSSVVLTVPNELVLPLGHAMEELNVSLPVSGAPDNFPSPGLSARYPSGKCAPSVAGIDMGRIGRLIQGRRTVYFITRQNNAYDPGNRIAGFLTSQGLLSAGTRRFMPGFLEVHKFVSPAARRAPAPSVGVAGVAGGLVGPAPSMRSH